MSKRLKIGLIALVTLIALGGVYAYQVMEPQDNFIKLEKTCVALTKNDADDRVYEPIVGRYLSSKSQAFHVTDGSKSMGYRMHIMLKTGEVEIYSSVHVDEYQNFLDMIYTIMGKEIILNKIDTDEIYGVCAYENEHNVNIGALETLVKLKD